MAADVDIWRASQPGWCTPHGSDQGTNSPGDTPACIGIIKRLGNADVRYGTKPTDQHEQKQPAPQPRPAETLVAIGDLVVKLEIEHHRNARGHSLCEFEIEATQFQHHAQYREMNQHTESTDQAERQELQRQQPTEHLVKQQASELHQHERIELALTGRAFMKHERDFDDPQWRRRAQCEIKQYLEALPGQVSGETLEYRSRQHEEAAHRVAKAYWQEILRQPNATLREHVAPACREPGIAAARAVSTANRQVVLAALKRSQHVGQLGFVVLQVSIDNRDELRRG